MSHALTLRIGGQPVDLAPDPRIGLELINPFLRYDRVSESTAQVPRLPASPRNQRLFRYFHEPQSGASLPVDVCELFYGGELIRQGYFVLTEGDETGYQGTFIDRLGDFFGDAQRTPLSELDLGTLPLGVAGGEHLAGGALAYALPVILNPDYYTTNGAGIGYTGRVNDVTGTSPVVPMIGVPYLIARLADLTGTEITGDFLTHPAYSRLLLYNTRALDGASEVTLAEHLPELTVEEFFLELRKLLNLTLAFDTVRKRLAIGFRETDLSQPTAVDWSGKALRGETKVAEQNTRLWLSYELDSGDALQKDRPGPLADYLTPAADLPALGLAKLSTKFSTLLVDDATGLATARQPGSTAQFGQGASRFAPRLVFWHGVVGGLPTALPTYGSHSLYWTGPNGLSTTAWAGTEARRTRQFYLKKSFRLTEADLALLDFGRAVHVNGVDYEVAQISGELPLRQPVQALLVRA